MTTETSRQSTDIDDKPTTTDSERMDVRTKIVAKGRDRRKESLLEVGMDKDTERVFNELNGVDDEDDAEAKDLAKRAAKEQAAAKPKPQEESRVAETMQTVVIYGKTYQVPEADIQRAGGLEAYQKQRAASIRMSEASATLQRAQRQKEELDRRQRELDEREKKLREQTSQRPQGQEPPQQGARQPDEDRDARVKKIVNGIFSGSEEAAADAIREILSQTEHREDLSAEEVSQRVLAKLEDDKRKERERQQQDEQARFEAVRSEVNRVMSSEYGDVLKDPDRRAIALSRFERAKKNPSNAGRSLTDLAREAGDYARGFVANTPEAQMAGRVREKQSLPPESSARARMPASDQPQPLNPKQFIERMRQHRAGAPPVKR